MNLTIRQARNSDAPAIVPLLRERDLVGLRQQGNPVTVIVEALQCSTTAFVASLDGEIAAMWGVRHSSMLDNQVYVWLLGTRAIEAHPVVFLRYSRQVARSMREHYALLYGECAHDFVRSVRWLTWLGARVWAPDPERGGRLVFAIQGESHGA